MKKLLIVAIVILGFSSLNAQVTFKPGIRAGANFSHLSQGDNYYYNNVEYDYNNYPYYSNRVADFTSKTDFYVGIYGALKLAKYYTLQPEINYTRQGSKIEYLDYNTNTFVKTQLDVSYISIAIINKFVFADKFNIHIGPTVDVVVDQPRSFYTNNYSSYNDVDAEIDLAFVLGAGYNFTKNIGIEARVKKGIIPVLDFSNSNHTNVVFSAGLTYTFDVK